MEYNFAGRAERERRLLYVADRLTVLLKRQRLNKRDAAQFAKALRQLEVARAYRVQE